MQCDMTYPWAASKLKLKPVQPTTAQLHHVPLGCLPLPCCIHHSCTPLRDADTNRQLVLLPDLSSTVQAWNKQWLLMLAWMLTSTVTVLVIAPLAAMHQWSMVSMGAIVTAAFSTVGLAQYGLKSKGNPEDGECLSIALTCTPHHWELMWHTGVGLMWHTGVGLVWHTGILSEHACTAHTSTACLTIPHC